MTIDTNTMISITEANQNFSKVARVVDEHGTAVILKKALKNKDSSRSSSANSEFFVDFIILQYLSRWNKIMQK